MPSSETLGLDRRQFMKTAAGAVLLAGAGVLGVSAAARAEAFPMPALPYAESALDPVISARTVSFHYGKHTAAYYANANKAVAENPALSGKTMEEIVSLIYDEPSMSAVFNNVAQALNHTFYWSCLKPGGGGEPTGRIKAAIEATFSSAAYFRKALSEAAIAQFASGWAWLAEDKGRLKIVRTPNAVTPIVLGYKPLFVIDVWEHAYYLDYQNKRGDYVSGVLDKLINWEFVEKQLDKA